MSKMYIKVDEHTPLLLKALVKYSPHPQKYFAQKLGISQSALSVFLSCKKTMPREIAKSLLLLLDFNPDYPYIVIINRPLTTR